MRVSTESFSLMEPLERPSPSGTEGSESFADLLSATTEGLNENHPAGADETTLEIPQKDGLKAIILKLMGLSLSPLDPEGVEGLLPPNVLEDEAKEKILDTEGQNPAPLAGQVAIYPAILSAAFLGEAQAPSDQSSAEGEPKIITGPAPQGGEALLVVELAKDLAETPKLEKEGMAAPESPGLEGEGLTKKIPLTELDALGPLTGHKETGLIREGGPPGPQSIKDAGLQASVNPEEAPAKPLAEPLNDMTSRGERDGSTGQKGGVSVNPAIKEHPGLRPEVAEQAASYQNPQDQQSATFLKTETLKDGRAVELSQTPFPDDQGHTPEGSLSDELKGQAGGEKPPETAWLKTLASVEPGETPKVREAGQPPVVQFTAQGSGQGTSQVLKLKIDPPNLGPLKMRLELKGDELKALFITEGAQNKALIEAGIPQLKQSLFNQGFSVQEVAVQVSDYTGGGAHQHPMKEGNPTYTGEDRKGLSPEENEEGPQPRPTRSEGQIVTIMI